MAVAWDTDTASVIIVSRSVAEASRAEHAEVLQERLVEVNAAIAARTVDLTAAITAELERIIPAMVPRKAQNRWTLL